MERAKVRGLMRRESFSVLAVVSGGALCVALPQGGVAAAATLREVAARASAANATDAVAASGWGQAGRIPGLAALNKGGLAGVNAVSCASAGTVRPWGTTDGTGASQAFVATETGGTWGNAEQIPGMAAMDATSATVTTVSCAAPGDCAAGGNYAGSDQPYDETPFVIDENDGVWTDAEPVAVPDSSAGINVNGTAYIDDISCSGPGDCLADGDYHDLPAPQSGTTINIEVFVMTETNGEWGSAQEVPGLEALSASSGVYQAGGGQVSCPSPGNCVVVGGYGASTAGFIATETGGSWTSPRDPGMGPLSGVSCASPGYCLVISPGQVISELGGTWGIVEAVPGLAALSSGGADTINPVSWAKAGQVPGTAFPSGNPAVVVVSCWAPGDCAAAGDYTDIYSQTQVFIARPVAHGVPRRRWYPLRARNRSTASSPTCRAYLLARVHAGRDGRHRRGVPGGLADVGAGRAVRGECGAANAQHERVGGRKADLLDRHAPPRDAGRAAVAGARDHRDVVRGRSQQNGGKVSSVPSPKP